MAAGPFLTPSGTLQARPGLRYTYRGLSVLVTSSDGAISGEGPHGFHHRNTRFLDRLELTADGERIAPFCAAGVASDRLLAYAAIRLPSAATDAQGWPEQAVYAELSYAVGDALRVEIQVRSYHPHQPATFTLGLELGADFADTEEAESGVRRQHANVERQWLAEGRELRFRYGHPALKLATAVRLLEAPSDVVFELDAIRMPIVLAARGVARVVLLIEPIRDGRSAADDEGPGVVGRAPASAASRASRELAEHVPRLVSTNATVVRAWDTAVRDLVSLPLGIAAGPAAPIAGLPLYQQFFGRDGLTVAWQSIMALPLVARDALTANAAYQGRRVDDWLDEEPGKMLHQARWGPLSVLREDPYLRYYGDYATVPDFLIVLGQYLAWAGDRELVRGLMPAARAGLRWLQRYADLDDDGFIEYVTRSTKGVKNQGWLDSGDAIVDADGRIVPNPIATSELQGYAYAALGQAALVAFVLRDVGLALDLLGRARRIRAAFPTAFWDEELGTFVQALGPDKRPIRTVASNAGHVLATGIAMPDAGVRVAARLMAPDMFSGWGVRTLSADHVAYDPFSYHRGSVWPVEQGTIAFGLARYGRWAELHRLAKGFFDLTELFVANRLPEVVGGVQRDIEHGHPGIYPRSHEPQAWSASSVILVVQALLGMRAFAPLGLLLVDPHLPRWLPDLELKGLRVGAARVDLAFRRKADGRTDIEVRRRHGRLVVRRLRVRPALARLAPFMG